MSLSELFFGIFSIIFLKNLKVELQQASKLDFRRWETESHLWQLKHVHLINWLKRKKSVVENWLAFGIWLNVERDEDLGSDAPINQPLFYQIIRIYIKLIIYCIMTKR
ncbi:hypothetical protein BpHYR1_027526 [Brachionus plicatilis]|uniref:Uncharacterized protein n=1 Tax=Brachionus plicatilis TaxID=10195 RepID=A0A3M7SNQ9_BRAPC|nr:hypothetical protein BpHYR1_027526 [Brachionus plicatilis]